MGPFKTSLDMVGVSVSLMRARAGARTCCRSWTLGTDAPAWPRRTEEPPRADDDGGIFHDEGAATAAESAGPPGALSTASPMGDAERSRRRAAVRARRSPAEECRDLCDVLDRRTGDGDCGTTLCPGR